MVSPSICHIQPLFFNSFVTRTKNNCKKIPFWQRQYENSLYMKEIIGIWCKLASLLINLHSQVSLGGLLISLWVSIDYKPLRFSTGVVVVGWVSGIRWLWSYQVFRLLTRLATGRLTHLHLPFALRTLIHSEWPHFSATTLGTLACCDTANVLQFVLCGHYACPCCTLRC